LNNIYSNLIKINKNNKFLNKFITIPTKDNKKIPLINNKFNKKDLILIILLKKLHLIYNNNKETLILVQIYFIIIVIIILILNKNI
jgi:hypothetical protein